MDRLKSIRDRLCWWYLNWCIRKGRIVAGIPEATLKAEVLPNAARVSALLAVGTSKSLSDHWPEGREVEARLRISGTTRNLGMYEIVGWV